MEWDSWDPLDLWGGVCFCVKPFLIVIRILRTESCKEQSTLNTLLCFLTCTNTVSRNIPGVRCLGLLLHGGIQSWISCLTFCNSTRCFQTTWLLINWVREPALETWLPCIWPLFGWLDNPFWNLKAVQKEGGSPVAHHLWADALHAVSFLCKLTRDRAPGRS